MTDRECVHTRAVVVATNDKESFLLHAPIKVSSPFVDPHCAHTKKTLLLRHLRERKFIPQRQGQFSRESKIYIRTHTRKRVKAEWRMVPLGSKRKRIHPLQLKVNHPNALFWQHGREHTLRLYRFQRGKTRSPLFRIRFLDFKRVSHVTPSPSA